MYVAYFFHETGKYQAKMYLRTIEQCTEFVFRYKNFVPKMMITNSGDESMFEAEAGRIVHPALSQTVIEFWETTVQPYQPTTPLEALLEEYIVTMDAMRHGDVKLDAGSKALETIEVDLLAIAANKNVLLGTYGWRPSDVVTTEIEAMLE